MEQDDFLWPTDGMNPLEETSEESPKEEITQITPKRRGRPKKTSTPTSPKVYKKNLQYGQLPIRQRPYYNPATIYVKTGKSIKGKWKMAFESISKEHFTRADVIKSLQDLKISPSKSWEVTASRYLKAFLVHKLIDIKK